MTRLRCRLNDFTAASRKPPNCEFGGLKDHCICRSARNVLSLGDNWIVMSAEVL